MHCGKKYVASLFLSAALMAPLGAFAMAGPQDDHERHEEQVRRVYDPYHKDYHNWDRAEDDVYRHWLEGRHVAYVDFEHLKKRDQQAYWNWRHSHEDRH
jgi:hypothetical protein